MNSVHQIIKQGNFSSDERLYRVVQLPANAITVAAGVLAEVGEAFSGLLVDAKEVTLILADEAFEAYQGRLRDATASPLRYRFITFDSKLDFDVVGFMAVVSQTLADADISLLAYASYHFDHFLVAESDFEAAMQALNEMKESL
jgi:hypothetical protein